MYNLKETIYEKYFLKVFHSSDPNKDSQGKGTLQRFVETLAGYLDETVISVIFSLLDATLIPTTVKDKFVPYLEKQVGLEPIHNDLAIRRRVLQRIIDIYKHKGTLKSYQLIFSALGFQEVQIVSTAIDFGFDSSGKFNDEVRTFDLGRCHKCKYYVLDLIGSMPIDTAMYEAILKAIKLVEPVYANMHALHINSVEADLLSIFVEANGDLVYNTLSNNSVGFTVADNGDLVVYGPEAENYSLDINGNLIYNGN